jgi:methyl-accepting chemotaxis protein
MTFTAAAAAPAPDDRQIRYREFVLTDARLRWRLLAGVVVLLSALRLSGRIADAWWFIAAIALTCAALNYLTVRLTLDRPFRPAFAHLNAGLGAGLISATLFALGPQGHLLSAAYLIAPLQTAFRIGPIEGWQALVWNITGFGLATALVGWPWTSAVVEAALLVLVCAGLIPTFTTLAGRLRAARAAFEQLEDGDLTIRIADREPDELGRLAASVNRIADALAALVRHVQQQARDLGAMAQRLAASSGEIHAATRQISTAAQSVSSGTERQRAVIGHGRETSDAAATLATALHSRARDAERQIADIAQEARRHGGEIAQGSELVTTLVTRMNQVADAAGTLEQGSREVGKLVDTITRIASQTDLLALNAAIEAARAGQHGLGFRVVATEVRKLAEQSGRSADEVRGRVKQIQDHVAGLVAATEEARLAARQVGTVSTAGGQALEAILADLNTTVQFAASFAAETDGQLQRFRDVTQSMRDAATLADAAAHGAHETSTATQQQVASLGELTAVSQHLSAAAARLSETVRRFQVNGREG